jgi:hypothetical protein
MSFFTSAGISATLVSPVIISFGIPICTITSVERNNNISGKKNQG